MREGLTRSVNCLNSAAYVEMRRGVSFLSGEHGARAPIAQLTAVNKLSRAPRKRPFLTTPADMLTRTIVPLGP